MAHDDIIPILNGAEIRGGKIVRLFYSHPSYQDGQKDWPQQEVDRVLAHWAEVSDENPADIALLRKRSYKEVIVDGMFVVRGGEILAQPYPASR